MEHQMRVNLQLLDLQKIRRSSQAHPVKNHMQCGTGKLKFPDNPESIEFTARDLHECNSIGTGSYGGVVQKMTHKSTGRIMAVKRIRAHEIDREKREKMLRELRIIIESQDCEDIVRFYGALFHDGDCWICMELLDCSLDKFYKGLYKNEERLPERVVGFIATSVVRALYYLKTNLKIIHRDVKPSNILLSKQGYVKLCDFGISGYLVDSIAETQPERLSDGRRYDIRSDVWSLGISLVEVCIGRFPYQGWNSVFDQLQAVVHGDPPFLSAERDSFYSINLIDFVNQCLNKDKESRPKFHDLMEHTFFLEHNHIDDPERMLQERKYMGNFIREHSDLEL